MTLGAGNDKLWKNFCTMVVDKPEWLTDPRYATLALRMQNIDVLEREIEAISDDQADRPLGGTARCGRGSRRARCIATKRRSNDPHVRARNMVVDIDHPIIGPMKTLGLPIKSTGDLTAIRKPAPWLGQHSEEVLRGIGYGDADIADLFSGKVVFDRQRAKAATV